MTAAARQRHLPRQRQPELERDFARSPSLGYEAPEVGLVRCWATRLGRPTVLVRRGSEKPLLLGVDDPGQA